MNKKQIRNLSFVFGVLVAGTGVRIYDRHVLQKPPAQTEKSPVAENCKPPAASPLPATDFNPPARRSEMSDDEKADAAQARLKELETEAAPPPPPKPHRKHVRHQHKKK